MGHLSGVGQEEEASLHCWHRLHYLLVPAHSSGQIAGQNVIKQGILNRFL